MQAFQQQRHVGFVFNVSNVGKGLGMLQQIHMDDVLL